MKKYLFICEKPYIKRTYEEFYNNHKNELDYEADFITEATIIWHPTDKTRYVENHITLEDIELLSLDKYPELPDKFYLLNSNRFNIFIEKIRDILSKNKYDLIVNAYDNYLEGYLLFDYIFNKINSDIPKNILDINDLTNKGILIAMQNLKDNKDFAKNLINNWMKEFNETIVKLNNSLNSKRKVKSGTGYRNGLIELKKDEIWTIVNYDEEYRIHIKKGDVETTISVHEFFICFR